MRKLSVKILLIIIIIIFSLQYLYYILLKFSSADRFEHMSIFVKYLFLLFHCKSWLKSAYTYIVCYFIMQTCTVVIDLKQCCIIGNKIPLGLFANSVVCFFVTQKKKKNYIPHIKIFCFSSLLLHFLLDIILKARFPPLV